jgi:hypothetical protein
MNTIAAQSREQTLVEARHAFWAKLKAAILAAGFTIDCERTTSDASLGTVQSPDVPEWEMPIRVERNGWKSGINRLVIGGYRHATRYTKLDDARITETVNDLKSGAQYRKESAQREIFEKQERARWKEVMAEQMAGVPQIPGIDVKIKDYGSDAGMYRIEVSKDSPLRSGSDEQVKAFMQFVERTFKIHPYRVGKRVRVHNRVPASNSEFEDGVVVEAGMDRIAVRVDEQTTVHVYIGSSTITLLD